MVEEKIFLKLKNPADMLAMRYFHASKQMSGDFVQEEEPPWNVWWEPQEKVGFLTKLGDLLKKGTGDIAGIWETGIPSGKFRKVGWFDLFKNFVLQHDPESRLSDLIIIKTSEKRTFFDIIRRHFLLQQGLIDFAVFSKPEPFWLIRIRQPSIWALEFAETEQPFEIFSQVPNNEGLFVESGWTLSAPENGLRLNQFRFMEKNLIFVKKTGEIFCLAPIWNHSSSVVDVQLPTPTATPTEEKEKIVVVPALKDTDDVRQHDLWKITDREQFRAIFSTGSMERFSGFSAWFGKDGTIWLLSLGDHADRGLATTFSDAFQAFSKLDKNVFVPSGKMIMPRLSEERFKQIFKCPKEDTICFESNEDGSLRVNIFPASNLKKIDFFLTFQTQNAIHDFQSYESNWTYDFPDLKKKE